jgi:methionyl-tRNA formyltransferase
MSIRVVFMGSPDFSLPSLRGLASQYEVVGVVTQPDRPAGRGKVLTPPPVKRLADELGLVTIQPDKLREPDAMRVLIEWKPDLIVVTAFGQILRKAVLEMPTYGCVNVHASLLPRWRGAAPIQAALLAGDEATGVTIMRMDAGIDTGDMLAQKEEIVLADDNTEILSARLSELGAGLLIETLPGYLAGKIIPRPQPSEGATYAGMIEKSQGQLDFQQPGKNLVNQIRAYTPWPGAFMTWQNGVMKVLRAHWLKTDQTVSGQKIVMEKFPAVGCADGWLVLDEIQPSGKKPMSGDVFLRGARAWEGL